MRQRTRIREVLATDAPGGAVTVKGWVRTVRSGKEVTFLALNDGSCLATLQVVAGPELPNYEEVARLGTGSAVVVAGRLAASPAAGQRFELAAESAQIIVVGWHLDSWDLAQGSTDDGTGATSTLGAAEAIVKSGQRPRRTIRFVLFTGEEQGLLGSQYFAPHPLWPLNHIVGGVHLDANQPEGRAHDVVLVGYGASDL